MIHKEIKRTKSIEEIQASLREMAKNAPSQLTSDASADSPLLSRFERDILVNRYILGGVCPDYERASLYNPDIFQTQVLNWLQESYEPSGKTFGLALGDVGCGKTFGCLAYITSICQARIEGRAVKSVNAGFVRPMTIIEWLRNVKKYQEKLEWLKKIPLLLLDDIATEPEGFRGTDFLAVLEDMFHERHMHRLKTLMTTNATAEGFRVAYGDRIASRFNQHGTRYESTDPDFRNEGR